MDLTAQYSPHQPTLGERGCLESHVRSMCASPYSSLQLFDLGCLVARRLLCKGLHHLSMLHVQ